MRQFFIGMLLVACQAAAQNTAPTVAVTPFTPEQIAVIKAFLTSYLGTEHLHNVANKTTPILITETDKKGCLKGLDLEISSMPSAVHRLLDEEFESRFVNLVGEQPTAGGHTRAYGGGLMQVSEVSFDATHQFAVMSYSYRCGHLCGNGATRVFQKDADGWHPSKLRCGFWIS